MGEIARLTGLLAVLLAMMGLVGWVGLGLSAPGPMACPFAIGHVIGC